ncbi:MAG: outer membrane protein transport protein [Desulfobacteraceae bacterium]|nr:outer membrane protein transport protein [Desulfobacteraceae bacterium]
MHKQTINTFIYLIVISIMIIGFLPIPAHATFNEQLAICAKSIALANACTADPPGISSIHFNPAGLSQLPEGKRFEQGFLLPWISNTWKYDADPDFPGFFGQWGPQEGQEHDPVAGTKDTNSSGSMYLPIYDDSINFLAGPSLGLSYRKPGSKWTFAYGNYAPYAGGMNYKSDSPANYGVRTEYVQHLIYAMLATSYQISDTLSVGVATGAGQTAMGIRLNMRSPNELVALTRVLGDATKDLDIPILSQLTLPAPWFGGGIGPYDQVATFDFQARDDFSTNYNIGLLWKPKKWFSYGFNYQSAIEANISGGYNFRYSDEWQSMMAWMGSSPLLLMVGGMFQLPTAAVPYQTGTVISTLKFPQRVQTGIMVKPTKRLKVLFDVQWAQWSKAWKENNFQTDQDIQLLQLVKMLGYTGGHRNLIVPRNFEDTISWSTGLEYQLTKKLALRCGYEWRPTSVQDYLADAQAFVPDLHNIGVGVSVNLLPKDGVTLDVGLGWAFNHSNKIPNNTSQNLNSTDFFIPVYNPYAGLDVEQKINIFTFSALVSMPFHSFIEHQKMMMAIQHAVIGKLIHLLKKPFEFFKKPAEEESAVTLDGEAGTEEK